VRLPRSPAPDLGASAQEAPFTPVFPRAHKLALGLAVGLTVGSAILAVTAFHLVLRPDGLPLELLSQYFRGYDVTWPGALIGFGWGFATGFVAGWMLGFVHNFTVGLWLLFVRARHDLKQTRNFLDHI
jgi:hypothetical protein